MSMNVFVSSRCEIEVIMVRTSLHFEQEDMVDGKVFRFSDFISTLTLLVNVSELYPIDV